MRGKFVGSMHGGLSCVCMSSRPNRLHPIDRSNDPNCLLSYTFGIGAFVLALVSVVPHALSPSFCHESDLLFGTCVGASLLHVLSLSGQCHVDVQQGSQQLPRKTFLVSIWFDRSLYAVASMLGVLVRCHVIMEVVAAAAAVKASPSLPDCREHVSCHATDRQRACNRPDVTYQLTAADPEITYCMHAAGLQRPRPPATAAGGRHLTPLPADRPPLGPSWPLCRQGHTPYYLCNVYGIRRCRQWV